MPTVPKHIAELIRDGRKIEAIKILREETGVDLQTAKEAVDKLDADPTFDPFPPEWSPEEVSDEVKAMAYAGQYIRAVRLLREQSGLGLKESKEIVEQLPRDPSTSKSSAQFVLVLYLIAIVLLGIGFTLAVYFLNA